MFERILIWILKKYQKRLPHDTLKFEKDIDCHVYFSIHELIKLLKEKLEG